MKGGKDYRVHGAAWTGESDVTRVEVSTDGGRTWTDARLLGDKVRHAWRLWEYQWRAPEKTGEAKIMARAIDAAATQECVAHSLLSGKRDPDRRTYMISHVLPVDVTIR